MSVIPTQSTQLTNKVIHCHGKNYTLNISNYSVNLKTSLDKHMEEITTGDYDSFQPKGGYPGFKIVTNSGLTILNSTHVPCPEDLHLMNVYPRSTMETIFVDDINTFFPPNVHCINMCFVGTTTTSHDINNG
ncbi:hypothetical protein NOVO_08635 [Rickettsiales bacterium Ac37b]|nr:hypothetical protein NOVO_08635 [Rickettsiales bacterium Ac37b]